MALIQDSKSNMLTALAAVRAHPMCGKFFDGRAHYEVHYPEVGVYPVDGIRVSKGMGKAAALWRLVSAMDTHWNAV